MSGIILSVRHRAVIGAPATSYIADKIGRKKAYAIAFVFVFSGITLEIIATTNELFFAGKFVAGFAIGGFGVLTVTYIAEICPLTCRGITTAAVGLSFTFGQFLVALIMNRYSSLPNRWAYRGIFVSQCVITALGAIFPPFMPE